jgi:predicted O-linked N-acetylglucosamine transferase (SPINDLY family)
MIAWLLSAWRGAARGAPAPADARCADPHEAVRVGLVDHGAGRLREAAAHYRQALSLDPRNFDALHFLGVVAFQEGALARAEQLISEALTIHAAGAAAHNNLGNVLAAMGKTQAAVASYLEAAALQPDYADALANLGDALRALGRRERAASCYRRALAIAPELGVAQAGLQALQDSPRPGAGARAPDQGAVDTLFNQGNALKDAARLDEAIASYRRALAQDPDHVAAHLNLGSALLEQGKRADALASFRRALVLDPDLAEAHHNLGIALLQAGELASARTALERFLQLRPGDRDILMALSEACFRANALDDAARYLAQVLDGHPGDAPAHNLLANVRRNQARHAEAIEHYELAIRHDAHPLVAYQNLLFCMMCTPGVTASELYARHRAFAQRFEQPLIAAQAPCANAPQPGRRLKIGYVSPELRANVVGHYMQPILERHDRSAFEVHCLHTGSVRDEVTARIAALADHWHDLRHLADEEMCAHIRALGIDILVDLCGHGPGNRILVFARKPAPVQVSYLDYSATTGLSSIDYRLTTEYCDPSGVADAYYSEKLVRLGLSYWTYNPSVRLPVTALPATARGFATFGSFNLFYRLSAEMLDLWMRLLAAVPGARLEIMGVARGSVRDDLHARMDRFGIARDRVTLHDVVSYERYHALMGEVDIALAPYPYNGATTVMDCLWNGLPVVALAGRETFSTRLGCSVLAQTGLGELIARDTDDYLRIAARLANDLPELAALRETLRERLQQSPLRDFTAFTRGLERAYRSMWEAWCASRGPAA